MVWNVAPPQPIGYGLTPDYLPCFALRSRMDDVDANSAHRRCAICGSGFSCGADRAACWCAELPPLPAERRVAGASCLCPACLSQRLGLVARSDADRGQ